MIPYCTFCKLRCRYDDLLILDTNYVKNSKLNFFYFMNCLI